MTGYVTSFFAASSITLIDHFSHLRPEKHQLNSEGIVSGVQFSELLSSSVDGGDEGRHHSAAISGLVRI